jgi:hypothetical protein
MNYQELLQDQFSSEINSVARYAKSIGFNPEADCFMTLMRRWLEEGRKSTLFIEENKSEIIKTMKFFIKNGNG